MTNITRDTPTGTAHFVPPSAAGARGTSLQLSSGSDVTSLGQEPLPAIEQRWLTPRARSSVGYGLTITDWRGGLNRLRDEVEAGHLYVAQHDLEVHFRQTASLPPETRTQSAPPTAGTVVRVSSYSQLGRLFMGMGSTGAGASLVGEGIGDPTLTPSFTYSPTGDVLSMEPIFIGGSSATERVLFGIRGARAQILSGSLTAPTLAATMDASLADVYGMIATELNDNTMLFLTAGGIKTLAQSNAATDPASTVLSNVPLPSKAIGLIKAAGGIIRAYWLWNNEIHHTDAEGGTPETLELGLGRIVDAVAHRDGLAATNSARIVYYNGRVFEDTYWQRNRPAPPDPGYRLICLFLLSNGLELIAECMWYDASGTLPIIRWLESYNHELKKWYQRGPKKTLPLGQVPQGMAKSEDPGLVVGGTGYVHSRVGPSFYSRFFEGQVMDPSLLQGLRREPSAFAQTPELILPEPIRYAPKTVDRIKYGGTLPPGSTVTVQVTDGAGAGSIEWTFKTDAAGDFNDKSRVHEFEKNETRIRNPIIKVTATRGDDITLTPNTLPVTVEFSGYLEELKKRTWLGWK